jgi:DNA primase large subunit
MRLSDVSDYPFLVNLREFLERQGLPQDLEDLMGSRYIDLGFRRALEDIRGEVSQQEGEDYSEKILGFYIALILISMTGDRRIFRRFAELETERVLIRLKEKPADEIISLFLSLGYRVEKAREGELCVAINIDRSTYEVRQKCYAYKIPISDYLRISTASSMDEPELILANRPVSKGYVYIETKDILAKICSNIVRIKIESMLKPLTPYESTKPYVEKIVEEAEKILGLASRGRQESEKQPAKERYSWVEKVISRGLPDGRKRFILYVLTPYMATILGLDEDEALRMAREFLDNSCRNYGACGKVYDTWIRSAFRGAKNKGIKPARLEKLDEELRKSIEDILSRET